MPTGNFATFSAFEKIINLLLFTAFAGCLVIDSWLSDIGAVLVLVGLFLTFRRSAAAPFRFERNTKLLVFAFCLFSLIATLSWALTDSNYEGWKKLGKHARFAFVIPVLVLFSRIKLSETLFWLACILASLLAAGSAIFDTFVELVDRAGGATNPILFSNLAILLGCLSLASIDHFRDGRYSRVLTGLAVVAFCASLVACVLSQTRSSWLALPVLLACLSLLAPRYRVQLLGGGLLLILAGIFLLDTRLEGRFVEGISAIERYQSADNASPIGLRLELWRIAGEQFLAHPGTGIGVGHFEELVKTNVATGRLPAEAAGISDAHNEYLNSLVTRGLPGLLALGFVFIVPLLYFARHSRHRSRRVSRLAISGLLIVLGYMLFALTNSVFERGLYTSFYMFSLAWIYILVQRAALSSYSNPRSETVSATIITKNEEDRIEACLQSVLPVADEIIVLDSGSTDSTVEIARRYTDKVEVTDWPGYGRQKQRALERATCDWVLSIDADEQLTPELAAEINDVLSAPREYSSYKLPWAVTIYGKQLDFGRSGRAPLRLFRREGASFSTAQVHEAILLPEGSKVGTLEGRLLHFTHRDYGHALEKNVKYSWLSSQKKFQEGDTNKGLGYATFRGILTFVHIYLFRLGFLDGRVGFLMAMMYSQNNFNKYAGIWTLKQQS